MTNEKINKVGEGLHNIGGSPKDAVTMKLLGGIKPEKVPLLPPPAGAAIAVNIRLNTPLFPPDIAQELEIELVVGLLKYIPI